MAIWPNFVLVPMAMGIGAAYFWRSLSFILWEYFLWWFINFDWWTRDVTSHVHLRVMEHIKALAEGER
jgi:hypothetical protein